jgi:4-hydroxy-2-oxoheptanedioate aldolase
MPIRSNALRAAFNDNHAVIGTFAWSRSTAVVEAIGYLGFDYVVIDNEHTAINIEMTEHLIRAAESAGIVPIVRIEQLNRAIITRALDSGAGGLIVPQVHNAQDAQYAVQAAKYHPIGRRGMAQARAARFGLTVGQEYYDAANRETLLIVQVENRDAVEHLPSILAVPGIDAILIGPLDLSQSLGYPGQIDLPAVRMVTERIIQQASAAKLPVGIYANDAERARHWRDNGCQMLLMGTDIHFMALSARQALDEWKG